MHGVHAFQTSPDCICWLWKGGCSNYLTNTSKQHHWTYLMSHALLFATDVYCFCPLLWHHQVVRNVSSYRQLCSAPGLLDYVMRHHLVLFAQRPATPAAPCQARMGPRKQHALHLGGPQSKALAYQGHVSYHFAALLLQIHGSGRTSTRGASL
jgi:hypothetical protein